MSFDPTSCTLCSHKFDLAERLPRVIPCGDAACSKCIEDYIAKQKDFVCPRHKSSYVTVLEKQLNNFPVFDSLRKLLEKEANTDFCQSHQKIGESSCLKDKCGLSSQHATGHHEHEAILLEDPQVNQVQIASKLSRKLEEVKQFKEQITNITEERKRPVAEKIVKKANEQKRLLEQQQAETLASLDKAFDWFQTEIVKSIGLDKMFETDSLSKEVQTIRSLPQKADLGVNIFECDRSFFEEKLSEYSSSLDSFLYGNNPPVRNTSSHTEENKNESCLTKALEFLLLEKQSECLIVLSRPIDSKDSAPKYSKVTENDLLQITKVTLKLKPTMLEKRIEALRSLWPFLKHIISIKVDFFDNCINNDMMKDFAAIILRNQSCLTELELNFGHCNIGDKVMIPFFQKMSVISKDLKLLRVRLDSTRITDDTLGSLADQVLKFSHSLESFEISLAKCNLTHKGVSKLFVPLQSVKFFKLNLWSVSISNETLDLLSKNCLSGMKKLESFSLTLNYTSVTDLGLYPLFGTLESVRKLELNLSCNNLTTKFLEFFAYKFLPKARSLEKLKLDLRKTKVTEGGLREVLFSVKYIKKFKLRTNLEGKVSDIINQLRVTNRIDWGKLELLILNNKNIDFKRQQYFQEPQKKSRT